MKKKLFNLVMVFVLALSCGVLFSACGKKPAELSGLAVEMVSTDYEIKNDVIETVYGKKVDISSDNLKVSLVYSDDSKTEIGLKTETEEGFEFSSTIPNDDVTPSGEYKITVSYGETLTKEIKVKVKKAVVDMSGVSWNYSEPLKYNGIQRIIELQNIPEGVTVSYEGNRQTYVGNNYHAKATFVYEDTENYEPIDSMELDWEIQKGDLIVGNYYFDNFEYDGEEHHARINGLSPNISYYFKEGSVETATDAGEYDIEVVLIYNGTDAENYNELENIVGKWSIIKAYASVMINKNFVYNGAEQTITADDFDVVEGVTISNITGQVSAKDVGFYEINIELEYDEDMENNYVLQRTMTKVWKIEKQTLTITAKNITISEGDEFDEDMYTFDKIVYEGFVGEDSEWSDDVFDEGTELVISTEYLQGAPAGEYAIVLSGLTSKNYNIVYVNGKIIVE